MEVILLEKIRNLGVLGDKVKVRSGYARNFLIPQGKAVYATKDNIEKFEQRRAELERKASEKLAQVIVRQEALSKLAPITLKVKAGEEGKLFGSIGTREIVDALREQGIEIEKREIRLSEGALRKVGEYEISIELESDITALIKLNIVAES